MIKDYMDTEPFECPYTINWPVALFTKEFFESPLSLCLSKMIFAVLDRGINLNYLHNIIREMEQLGFLTYTSKQAIGEIAC